MNRKLGKIQKFSFSFHFGRVFSFQFGRFDPSQIGKKKEFFFFFFAQKSFDDVKVQIAEW